MNLVVRESGEASIIDIDGRIDSVEDATAMTTAFNDCIAQGKTNIVANLEKVDYMNSAALGSLISAHKATKEKGGSLKLAKLQSFVMEVFKKSQLVQIFNIVDTIE